MYPPFLAGPCKTPVGFVALAMAMVFRGTREPECPRTNQSLGSIDFLRATSSAFFWYRPQQLLPDKFNQQTSRRFAGRRPVVLANTIHACRLTIRLDCGMPTYCRTAIDPFA